MSLALVDRLRALGPERARAILAEVETELGSAAVASLRYNDAFWLREAQVMRSPYSTIHLFIGERGTGKSHAGRAGLVQLLPLTERPRIVVPTDAAAFEVAFDGESGLARWTAPHIRCQFRESKGYAGDILYGEHRIVCMSAAGSVGAIGPGYGLTWADDLAAWITAVGEKRAGEVWIDVLKSNRARPGITIATTTGRAVEWMYRLMQTEENKALFSDMKIHDLGSVENNMSNFPARYAGIVAGLRAAGEWEEGGDPEGAFRAVEWAQLLEHSAPRIRRVAVSVDPAKTWHRRSCEVGVVAVGLDDRGRVGGLADRSKQMGPDDWPAVAHQLVDDMRARFREADVYIVVENNTNGKDGAALLRAEERRRRLERKEPGVAITPVEEVTSRPNDSKTRRARPIVALARPGQMFMLDGLGILQGQLSALTDAAPGNDRADAFVHGARDLAGLGEQGEARITPEEAFRGFTTQRVPAPAVERGDRGRGERVV